MVDKDSSINKECGRSKYKGMKEKRKRAEIKRPLGKVEKIRDKVPQHQDITITFILLMIRCFSDHGFPLSKAVILVSK